MVDMPFDHVSELATWMADAGIGELELTGPDRRLRLRLDGGQVEAVDTAGPEPITAGAPTPAAKVIKATTAGVFLHGHPMANVPLTEIGADVQTGQVVGLLAIGSLLVPVTAPGDGVLVEMLAADGNLVGYGTALAAFHSFET